MMAESSRFGDFWLQQEGDGWKVRDLEPPQKKYTLPVGPGIVFGPCFVEEGNV